MTTTPPPGNYPPPPPGNYSPPGNYPRGGGPRLSAGRTCVCAGSSIGKSIMKLKVVSEQTDQPIGFGLSVLRQIAHGIDAVICYIGYLFPLWDAKRHDRRQDPVHNLPADHLRRRT